MLWGMKWPDVAAVGVMGAFCAVTLWGWPGGSGDFWPAAAAIAAGVSSWVALYLAGQERRGREADRQMRALVLREIVSPELVALLSNVSTAQWMIKSALNRLPHKDIVGVQKRLSRVVEQIDLPICRAERAEYSVLPEDQALALASLLGRVEKLRLHLAECARSEAEMFPILIELQTPFIDDAATDILHLAAPLIPREIGPRRRGPGLVRRALDAFNQRYYQTSDD